MGKLEQSSYCKMCGGFHPIGKPCQPVTPTVTKPVTKPVTEKPVTERVTRPIVTKPVTRCPMCGHRVRRYQSNADKQRAYRQRKGGNLKEYETEEELSGWTPTIKTRETKEGENGRAKNPKGCKESPASDPRILDGDSRSGRGSQANDRRPKTLDEEWER